MSRLNLGASAAERDSWLHAYFVESNVYNDIRDGKASIIIGNRGSGKSAILRILAEREGQNGAYIISISPDDYSYEMLKVVLSKELTGHWAKQGAYHVSWKYVILIEVIRVLARAQFGKTASKKFLQRFLRDRFQNEQQGVVDHLISYLKRMESVRLGAAEFGGARPLQSLYRLEELDPAIPYVNDLLEQNKVYVMIDELDRGWDASEDAQQFVAGLFQAAIQLGNLSRGLRVLVSLRRELYDNIPAIYEDAQKVRDIVRNLHWSEDSLRQMIGLRIRHSAGLAKNVDAEASWHFVFEEVLSWRSTKSFNYIIDRTLLRP